MSAANKIFTNTAWQVVIRFFDIVIGVVNIGIIARILGQTQFGIYTTIFVFLQTIMTLADLGLYLTLLNQVSATTDKQEEKKRIDNIFTIRLVSAILVFALAPVLIKFFPYDAAVKTGVLILAGAFFWQSLISTLTAVFAKYFDMARAALVTLVAKLAYLIPLIYIYQNGGTMNQMLFWNTLASAASFLLLWIFIQRHQNIGLSWDFVYWQKVFRIAWPLSLGVVLNLVYFKADTLILSAYHSAANVGLYGAAYKVLEVLTTFPHMFMGLILPLFVLAWQKKDLQQLQKIQQGTFNFFVIINIWLLLLVWFMSKKIMLLVTGPEFVASGPILNILVLAIVAIFFGTMFTYLVVALDSQKQMLKYYFLAAIFGLAAYFIFIPAYSFWAAAIITVLVEIFIWWAAYSVVRKKAKLSLKKNVLWRAILSALICFVLFFPLSYLPVLFLGFLLSATYLSLLFIFKGIKKEDLKLLFNK